MKEKFEAPCSPLFNTMQLHCRFIFGTISLKKFHIFLYQRKYLAMYKTSLHR